MKKIKANIKSFTKEKFYRLGVRFRKISRGCTKIVEYCCTRVENVIMSELRGSNYVVRGSNYD